MTEKFNIKTVDGLQAHIPFGLNCKLCLPYVGLMIKTGKTEFEPIITGGDTI